MSIDKVAFWNAVRSAANAVEDWDLNESFLVDVQQHIALELEVPYDTVNVEFSFEDSASSAKDFTVEVGRERARVEFGYTIIVDEDIK